jgi:hypothetical protein
LNWGTRLDSLFRSVQFKWLDNTYNVTEA